MSNFFAAMVAFVNRNENVIGSRTLLKEEIGEPVVRNQVDMPSKAAAVAAKIDVGSGDPRMKKEEGIFLKC